MHKKKEKKHETSQQNYNVYVSTDDTAFNIMTQQTTYQGFLLEDKAA